MKTPILCLIAGDNFLQHKKVSLYLALGVIIEKMEMTSILVLGGLNVLKLMLTLYTFHVLTILSHPRHYQLHILLLTAYYNLY